MATGDNGDHGEEDDSDELREICATKRTVPDSEKYLNFNRTDLTPEQERNLSERWSDAHDEVASWEAGPAPIQGVYLIRGA